MGNHAAFLPKIVHECFGVLDAKIDGVEERLDNKIDGFKECLSREIAEVGIWLAGHRSNTEMHRVSKKRALKKVA